MSNITVVVAVANSEASTSFTSKKTHSYVLYVMLYVIRYVFPFNSKVGATVCAATRYDTTFRAPKQHVFFREKNVLEVTPKNRVTASRDREFDFVLFLSLL